MAAQLLEGKPVAENISAQVQQDIDTLTSQGVSLLLVAVQVGEDPATEVYVRNQKKRCEKMGMSHRHDLLPADTSEQDLLVHIEKLNKDPEVTGIILQTPLPDHINAWQAQTAITPAKDVEGMSPGNQGLLVYNRERLAPCTAQAVVEIIRHAQIDIVGAPVTIVGRSAIVGKPAALLLLERSLSATVTICHTGTSKRGLLEQYVGNADILVAAMGVANAIKGSWIKPGAVVIDVGMNQTDDGLVGDVEFEPAAERAGMITPVPGGVGRVTTSLLMRNVVEAAKWQREQ